MIELSAERGYEQVTVRSLTRLAGVSTRSFYKHFENAGDCFAYSYESLMQGCLRRASAAWNAGEGPEEAIAAVLGSVFEDVASEPKAAWLVLVEAHAAGPVMKPRIEEATAGFEALLSDGLAAFPGAPMPSNHLVAGIVAAVLRVARWRLHVGEGARLPELTGEMSEWVLALPTQYAPPERPDRDPLAGVPHRNGDGHREDPGPTILGEMGEERGRILSATVKLAATTGFSNLRIPRIRTQAGVSRRGFDACFSGVGECFLEAIEAVVVSAASRARSEARGTTGWEGGIYRGIRALCAEIASNPALARLVFVDVLAPGRDGLERRERLISLAADGVREGVAPSGKGPGQLVAEASSAAVWRIARIEIAVGRAKNVPRLLPLLAYVVLAPVVGPAAAAEVIQAEELRSIY
jgi:AcrR family transcriptional regulator